VKEAAGLIAVIAILAVLLLPHYHSADPSAPADAGPSAATTR
jgi:hypothetical protein